MSNLINQLIEIVGSKNVICGDEVSKRPKHFWNSSPLQALAIVKPATTAEVSAVMQLCHAAGQSIVTHGGVTGLVDGELSTSNDVVLQMTRMNQIESVDVVGRTLTVQAGCVLERIQAIAEEKGLLYALDLGARGSCTIGGNISTNAGGLSVLRYGMTRDQVLGLEAVLADGTIVSSMNSMMKNNAGYDLKQLFIGSEGTLGVITKAVLRLRSATPSVNTAILAFDNYQQVTATLGFLSGAMNGQLNAFEVLWSNYFKLGTNPQIDGTVRNPIAGGYPIYAIVETRGNNIEADQLNFEQAFEAAMERSYFTDAVIPQSEKERSEIWAIRENVDIVLRHHPKFIYDVSLPIVEMQSYLDGVENALKQKWPNVAFYAYGHLADGNLHLVVAPQPDHFSNAGRPRDNESNSGRFKDWYQTSNDIIYQPLQKLGGSISAEHGIGLEKKAYLSLSRTPEEIELMRVLKRSLDPANILNPGKII